jgi:hypothetical protein
VGIKSRHTALKGLRIAFQRGIMWPFVTKTEVEELKSRIEALEGGKERPEDDDSCPNDGHHLIETTSFGADRRTKMCPKCGRGYGFPHMEVR